MRDLGAIDALAFVDGRWIGARSIPVVDPADDTEIARVPDLGRAEAEEAIAAAARAFPS